MNIKNVVVIGSGTMGSGIAAQLCNANVPVTLLDLKTEISQKAKSGSSSCMVESSVANLCRRYISRADSNDSFFTYYSVRSYSRN